MPKHQVVSREQWLSARRELLEKEKALTEQRDALSAERRELPWVRVDKEYTFEGPNGTASLADLFGGRSQLVVYHFMFAPGWKEGCPGCSFLVDHIDGALPHLENHDVAVVVVSRAPLAELTPFKKRMGWRFPWVSSFGSDFNYDYHVTATKDELAKGRMFYNFEETEAGSEEQPGISVFFRDEDGAIYHTYSSYARGGDILLGAYNYLDLTPKGRNEKSPMDWMRHHDKYPTAVQAEAGARHECCSE